MIEPKRKSAGRPPESSKPRQQLSASIAKDTEELLGLWCAQLQLTNQSAHVGRILDLLVNFGKMYSFPKTLPRKTPLRPSEATGANYPAPKK